jgi:hypothetical protein
MKEGHTATLRPISSSVSLESIISRLTCKNSASDNIFKMTSSEHRFLEDEKIHIQ